MTTNLEQLKADYLTAVFESLPRLKSLAVAIRQEESKLTGDDEKLQEEIDKFWAISGDRQLDNALCQLASDLDSLDGFSTGEKPPTETAIATNTLIDMRDHNRDCMDFLSQAEAILSLVAESLDAGDTDTENKRLSIMVAILKIADAHSTLDTCLDFPLCRALGE